MLTGWCPSRKQRAYTYTASAKLVQVVNLGEEPNLHQAARRVNADVTIAMAITTVPVYLVVAHVPDSSGTGSPSSRAMPKARRKISVDSRSAIPRLSRSRQGG
jgi:hypothetical protein